MLAIFCKYMYYIAYVYKKTKCRMYIMRSASTIREIIVLIKRRDAIRLQLARQEIRWLSLAMQAFPAELSSGNIIFHYTQSVVLCLRSQAATR